LGGTFETTGAWTKKYPLAGTGTFTAIDVNTGSIRWQKKEPTGMVGGGPRLRAASSSVAVSGKGLFQALDAETGTVFWQHALAAALTTQPASTRSTQGVRPRRVRRHLDRRPRLGWHRDAVACHLHRVRTRQVMKGAAMTRFVVGAALIAVVAAFAWRA